MLPIMTAKKLVGAKPNNRTDRLSKPTVNHYYVGTLVSQFSHYYLTLTNP